MSDNKSIKPAPLIGFISYHQYVFYADDGRWLQGHSGVLSPALNLDPQYLADGLTSFLKRKNALDSLARTVSTFPEGEETSDLYQIAYRAIYWVAHYDDDDIFRKVSADFLERLESK